MTAALDAASAPPDFDPAIDLPTLAKAAWGPFLNLAGPTTQSYALEGPSLASAGPNSPDAGDTAAVTGSDVSGVLANSVSGGINPQTLAPLPDGSSAMGPSADNFAPFQFIPAAFHDNSQTASTAGQSPPAGAPYTVTAGKGQTLSEIAYENGVGLNALMAANPTIKDPNSIDAGQAIDVPAGRATALPKFGSPQQESSWLYDNFGATDGPTDVDFDFVGREEGGNQNRVYTVNDPGEARSGPTVGLGVDLNQWSPDDLRKWGLTDAEIAPFLKYMNNGLRGQAAIKYVKNNPYTNVPSDVLDKLNAGANKVIVNSVADNFNDANPTMNFTDLPPSVQTTLVDIAYQYGPAGLMTKFDGGQFWKDVTSNDWMAARSDINSTAESAEKSISRRDHESDLFDGAVDKNGRLKE